MKENQVVQFLVLTLGQALSAGFVPDGDALRHKSGASISQEKLGELSGKIIKGIATGNAEFPVTYEDVILHKSLISLETGSKVLRKSDGEEYELTRFDNGTVYLSTDSGDYPIEGFNTPQTQE